MTLYGKLANLHNAPAVRCAWSLTRRHLNGSGAVVTGTENCSSPHSRGLVLGVYANEADEMDAGILTPVATLYNERVTKGRLLNLLRVSGPMPKLGECRLFYDLDPFYPAVAVCGLSDKCLGYNALEYIDEGKEAIRTAAAVGCRTLQRLNINKIHVESFGHTESAAEGASMGLWRYQEFKTKKDREYVPQLNLHFEPSNDADVEGWSIGLAKASAQNLARELMEVPPNKLNPTKFVQRVIKALCDSGVNVEVRVREWAEAQGLNAFLAIAKGSAELPIFLELSYYGTKSSEPPIVLIGQGTTFNSGGVCLKKYAELIRMKGAIGGAACVVSTMRAIASMRLPVNLRGLIPLYEHMIGASALKPGDVIKSMNGTTVEVRNTEYDGVLAINDTLTYAHRLQPKFIVDVGSISRDIDDTLDDACAAVFTNSDDLWRQIKHAGVHTGDRVWRMPLWDYYRRQMIASTTANIQNVGIGRGGGACKAAAFLREFTLNVPWLHVEARGVMTTNGRDFAYLKPGMAGRPTRTLIEFIAQTTCNPPTKLC